ncbi:hypothetical protein A9K71_23185 [Mesorhizobium sp. WSM3873]|nr:hypothetical protein A9K71_23185 [Mesorhizobium sp. WSM3873]
MSCVERTDLQRASNRPRARLAYALASRLNSKLIHFVPRDNIIQHAELRKMSGIQYAPDSKQAGELQIGG